MKKKKITLTTQRQVKGFLGFPMTIAETKTILVDEYLYEKLKQQELSKRKSKPPYTLEEMFFYDELLGD